MWLLNAHTHRLAHFPDSNGWTPPYVILSHVWGTPENEASFQDIMLSLMDRDLYHPKYEKPSCFCVFAAREGFEWVWLDTSCIDKTNSTELSEAINSMWTWYRRAKRCYAFLPDVLLDEDPGLPNSTFRRSRWFTRGWTLQELLAPTEVVFVVNGPPDAHFVRGHLNYPEWIKIGTLETLAQIIEEVTQIDIGVLLRTVDLGDVSVAQKMSWAARRCTTRVEDRAYSLMGIFGVNLPTIYGEGEKAFMRLQLEILRQFPDQTIFAWGKLHSYNTLREVLTTVESFGPGPEWAWDFRGLLASSPLSFDASAQVRVLSNQAVSSMLGVAMSISDFSPTQVGIRLHLPSYDYVHPQMGTLRLTLLSCEHMGDPLALLLHPRPHTTNQYHVGVYHSHTPFSAPWYPTFRVFRIPRALVTGDAKLLLPSSHAAPSPSLSVPTTTRMASARRVIQWLLSATDAPESAPTPERAFRVADMYVHSHNAMVERSLQQRPADTADHSDSALPSLLIVFPGWIQLRLLAAGFKAVGETAPEWLPENSPNKSGRPGVVAKLPLRPGESMGVLYHSANTREFVLFAAGVGEASEVWATIRFPRCETSDGGATWKDGRREVLRRLVREWVGGRDEAGDRVREWDRGMKRFYDAPVGLARCVEVRMVRSNRGSKRGMEFTLGLDARWERRSVLDLGTEAKKGGALGGTRRSSATAPSQRFAASCRLDLAP